ncbi:MAG: acyltransferase [Armatimonadota bacterium]|nr:acyltransferase [Armatimonadota bacterium]
MPARREPEIRETFAQRSDARRNNFDALRFFLASLVVFSHSYVLLTANGNEIEPLSQASGMKMNLGTLAVACFFAISGFLITQSWLRSRGTWDFLKKRALRIYPGWIAAVLFCVLIVIPILRPHHLSGWPDRPTVKFVSQLALYKSGLPFVLPGVGYPNGSLWTIPFECMCYLLVVALGLLGLFHRRGLVLLLGLVLLAFLVWPTRSFLPTFGPVVNGLHLPYLGWLRCLPLLVVYFLSGASFFLFRERIPHSAWLLALSLVLVGLTLFHAPLACLFYVILPTFGFYILFYLAFVSAGNLNHFAKHGDLSYGIYLYSYPLQRLLIAGQGHRYHFTPLTLFLAGWVIACGAAALSWRFMESPFLRRKPLPITSPMAV